MGSGNKNPLTARPIGMVRASVERWGRAHTLCKQLQRVATMNARLDLMPTRGNWKARLDAAAGVSEAIDAVQEMVLDEVNRVTCEQLQVELARRQRKDAR